MPKFDINDPKSPDAATLYLTRDLLASAPPFLELAEVTAITASEKIVVGIHKQPWDEDHYTVEELKNIFCEAQIFPPVPAEKTAQQSSGSPTPLSGGVHDLMIRRHARQAEISTYERRNDLYIWFYDRICWLETWLLARAEVDGCPRLSSIDPICEGAFGMFGKTTEQGEFLWAHLKLNWGDEPEE